MHVVIFTGGKVQKGHAGQPAGRFVAKALEDADTIIAADCGAEDALALHSDPQVVLGDFDSLDSQTRNILKKKGIRCIEYKSDKDETDTELALQYATERGATQVTVIGGTKGNRVDHVIGNIFLSGFIHSSQFIVYGRKNPQIFFVTGNQKFWVVTGPREEKMQGEIGDLLSLIPLSEEVTHIETQGLQFPLKNEALYFGKTRGLSNVFISKYASIKFNDGKLLFIQTAK